MKRRFLFTDIPDGPFGYFVYDTKEKNKPVFNSLCKDKVKYVAKELNRLERLLSKK